MLGTGLIQNVDCFIAVGNLGLFSPQISVPSNDQYLVLVHFSTDLGGELGLEGTPCISVRNLVVYVLRYIQRVCQF